MDNYNYIKQFITNKLEDQPKEFAESKFLR